MNKTSSLLLRAGLAFAFVYAAISGFISPLSWIGFFPAFTTQIIPAETLIILWGILEIIIALWLLSGIRTKEAGYLSAALLLGVAVFNFGALDIVFRDISLALAALALAMLEKPQKEEE